MSDGRDQYTVELDELMAQYGVLGHVDPAVPADSAVMAWNLDGVVLFRRVGGFPLSDLGGVAWIALRGDTVRVRR